MKNKSIKLIGLAALVALGNTAAAQDDANKSDITELESVVVEGSKSNKTYLETNSSVQVVSEQKLEEYGIEDVRDLQKVVPGLTIEPRGSRLYVGSTLRGLSSPNYFSPSLSVYVDGVLQENGSIMLEMLNVKSVELLKGPQGTLYGGNTHGGIINIVTYKGSEDPYAQVNLSADTFNRSMSGILATPIGHGFSVDLALIDKFEKGTIDHTQTSTKDANSTRQSAATVGLHYRPVGEPFSASFKLKFDELYSHEELYISPKEYKEKRTDPNNFFTNPLPTVDRDLRTMSANMAYKLSDSMTIESVTGHQDREATRFIVGGNFDEEQEKFSQELRLKSTAKSGPSFVAGLYYSTNTFKYKQAMPSPQVPGGVFRKNNQVDTKSTSIFGDVTVPLSDAFDVSAGLRYSMDNAEIDYDFPLSAAASFKASRDDNILLPRVAFGLKLNELTKVFATASAGYKPAGYNYIPSGPLENNGYDAETSNNYEVGFKMISPDRRLVINTALYFIELDKIQVYVGQQPNQVLKNLGKAESHGIEIDGSYAFSNDRDNNLTFGLNWGRAEYTGGNDEANLKGRPLQFSPETTANLGIQVKTPQDFAPGKVLVGANARYTSKLYFNEVTDLSQDPYTLLDAHIKYVTPGGSSVKLFGRNLGDVEYNTFKNQGFGNVDAPYLGMWGERLAIGIAGTARL